MLVAAVVAARAARSTSRRCSWILFAVGLSLYGLGNLVWALWLEHVSVPPIPSICDVLWLALYPLSYAGIVGVARVRGQRKVPANVLLARSRGSASPRSCSGPCSRAPAAVRSKSPPSSPTRIAFGLACLTVLAATARMALAFRDLRGLAEARRQASTDDLTLLSNRRRFMDRARDAVAAANAVGGSLSVLMLDLDNFKERGDTLGHQAGDMLLRRIGPRLRRTLRSTDTIARLGGDEFGILIDPLPDMQSAAQVAQKVRRALAEPFPVQGLKIRLTAGIGIASFPTHALSPEELLRRADVAMHLAKAGRCGYAFYAPDRDTNSRERLVRAAELASALETGAVEVHFQPIAGAATRAIVGFEALARWRRSDASLVMAADFVQAAEESGLSRMLTRLVLARALDELRAWERAGRDLQVSVNTSVADLLDSDFPDEVAAALAERELPPGRFVLEVTETAVLSDPARIGKVLARLGELGVELSLDDFGTGYSSLSHLRSYPVREVKVDRSFVSWMCEDQTAAAIVYATIQLAHRLGMRVVAEGVEDERTWQVLADLGCELVQGHALGRPAPAADLEELLAGGSAVRRAAPPVA